MAEVARRRYGKLIEWAQVPHEYGLEALTEGFEGYEKEVIEIPKDFLRERLEYSTVHVDGEEFHSGEQNTRVVIDAENYYKAIYLTREESWNLRDTQNIGQLYRSTFGAEARIIRYDGSHGATVVAADLWEGDIRIIKVRPGLPESYEALIYEAGVRNFALDLRDGVFDEALRRDLMRRRL